MPARPLRIALVGAESTGKSTLAVELARRLADEFGLQAVHVEEVLRRWCDARGRTPRADEQAGIAQAQQACILAADAEVVLCDTTPLMTAVYSQLVFGDLSLDAYAQAAHRAIDHTLLTALDLPWVPDGLQRDGPQVRGPVDAQVRRRLLEWGADFSVVQGWGPARAEHALDALRPLLRRWVAGLAGAQGSGLFTRLLASGVGPPGPRPRCDRCDQPECEHRPGPGARAAAAPARPQDDRSAK